MLNYIWHLFVLMIETLKGKIQNNILTSEIERDQLGV